MSALATLASGVAHDFSNLLTVISGNAYIALDELPPSHPLRERLGDALNATNRAIALLTQLATFSRREDARRSRVALHPIAHEVVDVLRLSSPPRVRFDVQPDASAPSVMGDASQLRQLVQNLCTNAVEAIGDNDGTVTIRAESIAADEASCRGDEPAERRYTRLRVSDDGCGMEEATRVRMFEPFFTTHCASRRGLGLAIAYGIIENHRGVVRVESEPKKGTVVDVFFHRAEREATSAE